MKIITKIKSIALVTIMLILTSTMAMAERNEHNNKHTSTRHVAQAHYNDRSEHQHKRRYDNEYRHHNKHQNHGRRHYNKHNHYFDKHAYKYGRRNHHKHSHYAARRHNYYQPARILLGLHGGNFSFLFRD
ncbi:MAG: hypothetical protein DRQ62_08755 [Gammaproteobacteria bacterium]|nr:MAG: hypothetical protein DRQ62_08755 [Gammaproteobacteria bacterium]